LSKELVIAITWLLATPAYAADCVANATVTDIYPTAEVLPENLLRFYIYFDAAMSRENALDSIHLLDKQGKKVQGAFLANKVDLWSPDARRLTILFDPGRVKTGLVAHNELGRALNSGQQYSLLIDKSLRTADGCALESPYRKTFKVSNEDFESPDLTKWKIIPPKAGTQDWFSLKLNGPHDHVSLAYQIRVIDPKGNILPGRIALDQNETEWRFKPDADWSTSSYRLQVNDTLEDVAGNRLTGSFEAPIIELSDNEFFLSFQPK